MNARVGNYVIKKTPGETVRCYVPPALPPEPPLKLDQHYGLLEKATAALARLNAMVQCIPNHDLFLLMYVRKEALLSSQIEGTQSSLSDLLLFENKQKPDVSIEDVEEVSNYVQAMRYGLKRLKDGFPLSIRLLKDVHGRLLAGTRGAQHLPGELRRSQNWIGGTRPGNALYVPPPVECLADCLSNLEAFLHEPSLPVLVKAALAHVQFESIHPFLDGNGRLGRLLITLMLCEQGLLDAPVLYLSLYLKQNRQTYYALLQEVRTNGTWETWLEFFLEGVVASSEQAVQSAQDINALFDSHAHMLAPLGRARLSCEQALAVLKVLPQLSVQALAQRLDVTAPTARKALHTLAKLGIVHELTGKKRDQVYVYKAYLSLLEAGAEPLAP